MEEELRALLIADPGVASFAAARVNWGAHPQGRPYPGLVLHLIGNREGLTLTGPDGLFEGRVQVDCLAMSFGGATLLSRAVIALLHGYRGGGFRLVEHDAARSNRVGANNEADRPFLVSLDFLTNWRIA
ncbi:tail completion protein gp17 [Falsihalocynthiibacter arcticus]|uniref:tail completion protein gp17 n=1 Tax=Falsihalocynthiibacter arcticus TaxID=1579316 RepID=UPI0030038344